MENKKGIIIKHPTGLNHSAFDILVHKDNKQKIDEGYPIDNCRYIKKYLQDNPNYKYVTSEDNGHIPEFNWIDNYVMDLLVQGWKLITYNEDFEIIDEKEINTHKEDGK